MSPLDRLERTLGRFAVPRLTLLIVLVQAVAWFAVAANPGLGGALVLESSRVLAGEWWRVFTFVMLPPATNPLFVLLGLYVLWLMGTALEQHWGDARYNLYWLVGWAATVGASFAVPGAVVTNAYLDASVFLAFAFLFPDFEFLLFLILPVKVKWIAAFTWMLLLLSAGWAVTGGDWSAVVLLAAGVLNFFVFFGPAAWTKIRGGHRAMVRRRDAQVAAAEPFHKCSVCGITDHSHPRTDFRYAAVGDDTRCFCPEHLPRDAGG